MYMVHPPRGPWFGAFDLYIPVFYAFFSFLDLCQNWGRGGGVIRVYDTHACIQM